MKVATKSGATVVLKKAGKEAFSEAVQKYGAKEARNKFAEILVSNPQFIDEGGIKFFGQTIVSTKALKAVTSPVVKTAEKIPLVKSTIGKIKSLDEFSAVKSLPNGDKFVSGIKAMPKATRSQILDATEQLAKQNSEYIAKYGDEFASHVTNYIETGKIVVKNGDMATDIAKVGNEIIKVEDILAKAEMARGLLKSTLGESIGKVPVKIKGIVSKYTDDIIDGTIKSVDDWKKILTKDEKVLLKGANTPTKLFAKIVRSKPNTENYIKHFLTERGRKYLDKGGDFYGAIPKPLRAKLQSGNMRTMRSSISEINEKMKSLVGGDFFEPNAFKSLAARQAESIKAINIFDFVEGVKSDYGIQAIKGETERIIDGVRYIKSTSPQLEGMLVPEAIAQHIDDTVKFINGDKVTNDFLKGYDKLLRIWKGSVTGYFPAFHTRNFLGGTFNNWLAGVDPTMYVKARQVLSDAAKENKLVHLAADGVEYTSRELLDLMKKTSSIKQPGMIDVMEEVEGKIGKNIIQKFGEYPRVLMELTEDNLRAPLFLDRVLKRGWLPEEAAKDVFKFHFDYAPEGLSTFERLWMKRLMPFYTWCVPDDTEILTMDGWKTRKEIKIGDEVLTYNVKSDINEWQKIKELEVFDFNGELATIENKVGVKFRFTKNHRFPVICNNGKRKIIPAYELNSGHNIPIVADSIPNKESILTVKEATLLGWLVTDGYTRFRGNSFESVIYQHPKKHYKKIRDIFSDWITSEYVHPDTGVICFHIGTKYTKNIIKYFKSKEDIPSIVTKLSREAQESMYEAMLDAEGSRNFIKGTGFSQKLGGVLDGFQILCFLLGKSFNISVRKDGSIAGGYVRNRKSIKIASSKLSEEYYEGKVWCPVTENSTWIMRQNGKVIITGNTRNNIPLQIEMMARTPGKYAALGKIQNVVGGEKFDDEFKDLPDWMKEQLNLRIGENNGLGLWLQLNLPIEDIGKLPVNESGIRETVSLLSPFFKIPIELITNRNLYFGGDIVNPDLKDYPELQRSKTISNLDKLPQPIKDFLNIKKVKKKTYEGNKIVWKEQVEMDTMKLYTLKSLFGRFYSAIDQIGGEETETQKMLRLLGGVPLREIDIENQRYWNEYEKQKAEKAKASFEKARVDVEE
ncbi:MAG: hypothetical protein PHS34_09180 [Candidatus Omnitrophica bacterium]|nr:hypothetical protein [Candidatus Omnitrophota bacterium]